MARFKSLHRATPRDRAIIARLDELTTLQRRLRGRIIKRVATGKDLVDDEGREQVVELLEESDRYHKMLERVKKNWTTDVASEEGRIWRALAKAYATSKLICKILCYDYRKLLTMCHILDLLATLDTAPDLAIAHGR